MLAKQTWNLLKIIYRVPVQEERLWEGGGEKVLAAQ